MHESSQIKRPLLTCLLATLAVGLLALLPSLIRYHGQFLFYGDFITQYVPFIRETRRMLLSGSFTWSWNSFLGDNFYTAYSYYTSTNPFALIAALFPDSMVLYATTVITLLKFLLSSFSAYLFLRLFVRRELSAVIGAIAYTFSGFSIIVTNYCFFLDVIAVFPLLLYGLEWVIRREHGITDGLVLTLAVFVNAVMNYYLFVSSCILCLLYVVFRLELWRVWTQLPDKLRSCGRIIGYGGAGVLLSGFALIPSLLRMMNNPKATENLGTEMPVLYSLGNLLERIRIFFMPIESHTYHAFYNCFSRGSVAVYLGLFGCVFALAFVLKNRRSWIAKLWIALIVILLIPAFNSVFNLFTDIRYSRWLYGMVLVMDVATVCALDRFAEPDMKALLRKLYKISLVVVLALTVPITGIGLLVKMGILPQDIPALEAIGSVFTSYFAGFTAVVLAFGLAVGNYFLLGVVLYGGRRVTERVILLFTCVCCACNFAVYSWLNCRLPSTDTYSVDEYYTKFMQEGDVIQTDTFSRIDYPKGIHNYGLFFGEPAVGYYHSIQNKYSAYFASFIGMIEDPSVIFMTVPDEIRAEVDTLLSVRYYTDYMQTERSVVPQEFTLVSDNNGVKTYENQNYLPMGFTYDHYVLTEEAASCDSWFTAQIALSALIIAPEDEARVSELLDKLDLDTVSQTEFDLRATADARRTETADSFEETSSGFTSTITLSRDNYVFYSVPYDDNWEATVNGEPAEIVKVCDGLVAVRCAKGENTISFTAHTYGLTAGLAASAAGLVIVAILLIRRRKERS
ncbi:MAG: YfhO family protein [Butyricicoccus sp.]